MVKKYKRRSRITGRVECHLTEFLGGGTLADVSRETGLVLDTVRCYAANDALRQLDVTTAIALCWWASRRAGREVSLGEMFSIVETAVDEQSS